MVHLQHLATDDPKKRRDVDSCHPKNQLGPSKKEGFDSLFGRVLLDLQTTSFVILRVAKKD